jgi:predicted RecB family nuclease
MHRSASDLILSATDLAAFSGCAHRTWLDHARAHGLIERQRFEDKRLELLQQRGIEHEDAYLRRLEAEGQRVRRFGPLQKDEYGDTAAYRRRHEETLAAMREGHDVIYQGTLFDGRWLGLVDFLLRVDQPADRPSALGSWSYEVADAKLTRHAKASAVLQTCVYSEMLAEAQGARPERIHLYLGGPTPRLASFRLAHFAAYQRALAARMGAHLEAAPPAAPDLPVSPDPVELCQMCDWRGRCREERVEADHLSLVAGIRADQRQALMRAGVSTLEGLATLPLSPPPEDLRPHSFERIREQARVQLEGRTLGVPMHEVLPLEANPGGPALGLAALPEPTPHDWFFDFEGADYAYDGGLEYLWGISDARDGFRCTWALTQGEEKAALTRFLAEAEAHVEAHPGAHIYHFGHYEPTALKRLVGRYDVGTGTLDRLLQREVFVDLHRVARQGVRASVESYSIKALEAHYGFEREVAMDDANPARYRLEYALALGLRDEEALADRDVVERYNRDDCVSTRALRDWLEGLRAELEAREGPIPRPVPPEEREEAEDEDAGEVAVLMEALLDGVPEAGDERSSAEHVRWLAAHLLEWHRREDKTAWWDYFRLRELSVNELVGETTPLAGLEYVGNVGSEAKSFIHRFRFPPQDHRLEPGKGAKEPARVPGEKDKSRMVWDIDDTEGWIELKVGRTTEFEPEAINVLFRDEIVGTKTQRAQLRQTARLLLESEDALADWSPASLALLRGEAPSFGGASAEGARHGGTPETALPAVAPDASLLDRAREAALRLEPGVLPVQGPPGTGKTYSGARMIRALLRAGLTVGVTGPSHKVITNLLDAVCEADEDDEPTRVRCLQVSRDDHCADPRVERVQGSGEARRCLDEGGGGAGGEAGGNDERYNLVAGTAWLWSREDMERSVDVLFIDEAGQFSLANALAVAPAAPRLVLLGDPQQLNQPQKGIHPPGAEVSVLEHLAGEGGIVTPEKGLFLGETWRMRPEITAYTSELFYEGKLAARADLERQRIELTDGSTLQGLHLEEVSHEGNSRESPEEAEAVVRVFRRVLARGATFTDRKGETRALGVGDLLVVAPYNAQVDRIRRALEAAGFDEPRVGTVDKFQGQEGPVAIYSLASSSAQDAPRGMEFLYALDRLNVATSRARVATVVVASPRVLTAECRRPEQMRMVNALVRYGELAGAGG